LNVNQCPSCKIGTLSYCGPLAPVRGPPVYSKIMVAPIT
jgi:hypothetical protein